MNFLKYTLATILGLFLFLIISIFIFMGIGAAASQKEEVKIKDTSVLELNLGSPISEKEPDNPFEEFGFEIPGAEFTLGLKEIKECIRNASQDERIKAIYLNSSNFGGGFAMATEIRKELEKFKESGKPIIAYSEYYSEAAYALSTVADTLLLHPMGLVEFNGFNLEMMFLGGTLEKLDIKAEIIKVGDYKSAAESLVRKDFSEENEEQLRFLIDEIYADFINDVARGRGIDDSTLLNIVNTHKLRTSDDVLASNMVDMLANKDESIDILKTAIGVSKDDKIELVSYGKYKNVNIESENTSKNRIAVLVAEGEINSGESDEDVLGSDTFAEQMRKLRENERVKAVVVRVNSPGGSAVASEIMAREIALTKEKKPVVASMSDVAASGGYWISMGCDKIIAQPNTITGSIGVIGVILNIEKFMENKLGITFDRIKTGEFADIGSGTHEMTETERAIIQESVDDVYDDFTTKVAFFRNMDIEEVKNIAGGRVWTGKQALERKLVDELGGLERAVEVAAELANLEDYKVRYYPPKESFFEKFMKGSEKEELMTYFFGEPDRFTKAINTIKDLENKDGIIARLPYGFEISY
ncbi:MAG: signal peptide peptidase SppA [Cytophagales bacterium]